MTPIWVYEREEEAEHAEGGMRDLLPTAGT
jgi:hypothetical protein